MTLCKIIQYLILLQSSLVIKLLYVYWQVGRHLILLVLSRV